MDALSIISGIALSEEPGLGALTLPGYLRTVTSRYAGREALVMGTQRWSYADLWARSIAVARALTAIGVGKDSRVGILMTNRPEWLSAMFGTALAGGVGVMLNSFSTAQELEYLLKASSVSVLLFEGRVVRKDFVAMLGALEPAILDSKPGQLQSIKFPFLRHLAVVGTRPSGSAVESWGRFLERGEVTPPALVEAIAASVLPTDCAALFFSSGSTAQPKGIFNAHRGIAIQLWRWGRMFSLSGDVRSWTPNGFFWSGNFGTVLGTTLTCGGSLVLQHSFIASEALRLMEKERVNFPMVWPHQGKQLEEAPNWREVDLSAIRFAEAGTSLARHPSVSPSAWKEPCSYGSTETFTITTGYASDVPDTIVGGSHGEVLPGNTLKIVDPLTGETLPRGLSGEIAVKGPTLMLGYLGVPVEEALDGEGFYRTGDGGYVDDRGRLYFEGRLTTVIKTAGANVSPLEINVVLEAMPGVKAAGVVGVPHDTLGEMVVACIVLAESCAPDEAAILAFARERLASYKVPRRVLFLREDELSLTGSAKIKAHALRELAMEKIHGAA